MGQRYRAAGRLRVRAGKMVNTGKTRKQEQSRDRSRGKTAGSLVETKRTGNRQTENTFINTQVIMGKMGDIWRGVDSITKTGETDQGVYIIRVNKGEYYTAS